MASAVSVVGSRWADAVVAVADEPVGDLLAGATPVAVPAAPPHAGRGTAAVARPVGVAVAAAES